jgi:hypothetical protein
MATWTLSTAHKKSAVERQIWVKDDLTIVREDGYRWGNFYCESETRPDVDLSNPDGYELSYSEYEWELSDLSDGCWADWEWPDDMPEDERERIETLWSEEWYEGMEGDGWELSETEYIFYGPLTLESDNGETYTAEDAPGSHQTVEGVAAMDDTDRVAIVPNAAWPFPSATSSVTVNDSDKPVWPFPIGGRP